MTNFDYKAPAEIFGGRGVGKRRHPVTYRRFDFGADALRFAIEEMPAALLVGITLQADDDRFDHRAIRALYESAEYPLARNGGAN